MTTTKTSLPATRRDLTTEHDIATFVRRFYGNVAQDELLRSIFVDGARVDWTEHISIVTMFWCRALLHQPGYTGNPLRAHRHAHATSPFSAAHFDRWLQVFVDTVEDSWSGPNATRAINLACRVAEVHSKQIIGTAVDTSKYRPTPPTRAQP